MVLNIAHRGARSIAPENTLPAAQKAFEIGAHMWETDVAVTKDQKLVIFHDDSLSRTTNVSTLFPDRDPWTICDFTLKEILQLDAGSVYIDSDPFGEIAAGNVPDRDLQSYKAIQIPTLEETLVFTIERNWPVNLELKALPTAICDFPVVDHVIDMLEKMSVAPELLILSSFNHEWIRHARNRKPDYQYQALVGIPVDQPLNWGPLDFSTYNANHNAITNDEIRKKVNDGFQINLFNINDLDEMKQRIHCGVSGIITDYPQRMKEMGYTRN